MREANFNLPSIEPRKLFITEPNPKHFNKYKKLHKNTDRSEILNRYMDSAIIKKVNHPSSRPTTPP